MRRSPQLAVLAVLLLVGMAPQAEASPFRYVDRRGHVVVIEPEAAAEDESGAGGRDAPYAFAEEISSASAESRIPAALIRAVVLVESNGHPRAVSVAGAQGLMQLMPRTAEEVGVTAPFDPRENILGGARYLRKLLDTLDGDLPLALAAYNAGKGAVERAGRVAPSRETRRYVAAVLFNYQRFAREETP